MDDAITRARAIETASVRKRHVPICKAFRNGGRIVPVAFAEGSVLPTHDVLPSLRRTLLVPGKGGKASQRRVAVLFSGGPASGGHDVVAGIARLTPHLYGVRGGPGGLLKGDLFPIKDVHAYERMGGFDLLGTDRTKISTDEQFARVMDVLVRHRIDALIIIGGDDSNTNAAYIADRLPGIQVISVPKTMDGDLMVGSLLPVPFGFDTATKVYAELVGNIARDAVSSRKYWHFIRLMGRDASHVTLEVALRTQPTVTLIAEEAEHQSLPQVIDGIVRVIRARASQGKHFGVILIPEGLLEALPDVRALIRELDELMVRYHDAVRRRSLVRRVAFLARKMSKARRQLFLLFPPSVQQMLTLDRDAHGNLNVSQIPTEQLLSQLVLQHVPVSVNTHFFGYEGRCGVPSLFDATLGYNLGLAAASLVHDGRTGYMAAVTDLDHGGKPLGIPLAALLAEEERQGKQVWVIRKSRIELSDPAFRYLVAHRNAWAEHDPAEFPAPRQLTDDGMPFTVALNQRYAGVRFRL